MPDLDWLILTAANAAQAKGYRAQLASRQALGMLPGIKQWRVIADPGDRRVGSGGSTLWVLHEIARERQQACPHAKTLSDLFAHQRILVIHSGGDSKRLCAYAAQGKVFTPLPCPAPGAQRQPATLFDLILADLAQLDTPDAGHVLLAAGDALLTFDHEDVNFHQPGVVGVAFPGPVERGTQHGIYVTDPQAGRVVDFLQKPSAKVAADHHAVDGVGRVLIDTGLVGLDPPTVERWLAMAGVKLKGRPRDLRIGPGLLNDLLQGDSPDIDLYEQLLMAMPPKLTRAAYLRAMGASHTGAAKDSSHHARLATIHQALHKQPFHACVLSYCDFFHVGANRDLIAHIATLGRTAKAYGFSNRDRAMVADRAAADPAFIYNALLGNEQTRAGQGVFIEACHTTGPMDLPGPNVLVGLPPSAKGPFKLLPHLGLVCLPMPRGQWAGVAFGLDDDFKTARAHDGSFANQPFDDWLNANRLTPAQLWKETDPGKQTLWNAKLWIVGPIDQVIQRAQGLVGSRRFTSAQRTAWLGARRRSLAQLVRQVDHARLIAHRLEIQRRVSVASLGQAVIDDPWRPADDLVADLHHLDEARLALDQVRQQLDVTDDALTRARLLRLAHAITQAYPKARRKDDVDFAQAVTQAVAASVVVPTDLPPAPASPTAAILPDQVVWVTAPVRMDFHGGWSDTPPICTEMGGTVLNTAITLNDQYPVQVIAKLTHEPTITLRSIDLGQSITFTSAKDVAGPIDPTQCWALPKAALRLSGLWPKEGTTSLKRHLQAFGGGLDLTIFSALPKGSGLGTSSVLGAAMLACLSRVLGQPQSPESLSARTSKLEQLMTTGGGWQDQVGTLFGGTKLIRTQPGQDQTPAVQWTGLDLAADPSQRARYLLYFTGIQRMARNILQKVVWRYLARDPQTIDLVTRLKAGAQQMKSDLDAGDLDAFARGIDDYWACKRALDPGSTNPRIEALLKPINRYLDARLLPGAGGGGFVFMIAKDADAARQVRTILEKRPPNALARFFDFEIDRRGLHVTVL